MIYKDEFYKDEYDFSVCYRTVLGWLDYFWCVLCHMLSADQCRLLLSGGFIPQCSNKPAQSIHVIVIIIIIIIIAENGSF